LNTKNSPCDNVVKVTNTLNKNHIFGYRRNTLKSLEAFKCRLFRSKFSGFLALSYLKSLEAFKCQPFGSKFSGFLRLFNLKSLEAFKCRLFRSKFSNFLGLFDQKLLEAFKCQVSPASKNTRTTSSPVRKCLEAFKCRPCGGLLSATLLRRLLGSF